MQPPIKSFSGGYRFLSNFWPAPLVVDRVPYPTVEHAYQAAKTHVREEKLEIAHGTAAEAKRRGQSLTQRPDWEEVKIGIMTELVRMKFTNHPDLKAKLLATGTSPLVEGNTWGDTFWGVCDGVGTNHLGKILEKVRLELAQATADMAPDRNQSNVPWRPYGPEAVQGAGQIYAVAAARSERARKREHTNHADE